MLKVKIYRNAQAEDLPMPEYMSGHSAGLDLAAAVEEPVVLKPGQFRLIPTGIHLQIPTGHEGQVRPRSGLAAKYGITVLNSPGTIDSDYRGEIKVILINLGDRPFTVNRGDRIAQLVVGKCERVSFVPVDSLDHSSRGDGGFGHTGI